MIRTGFEPATRSLGNCRSILLSYRTVPSCIIGISGHRILASRYLSVGTTAGRRQTLVSDIRLSPIFKYPRQRYSNIQWLILLYNHNLSQCLQTAHICWRIYQSSLLMSFQTHDSENDSHQHLALVCYHNVHTITRESLVFRRIP